MCSSGVVYITNLEEEGEDRVTAAYSAEYDSLLALRNKYGPTPISSRLHQTALKTGSGFCGALSPASGTSQDHTVMFTLPSSAEENSIVAKWLFPGASGWLSVIANW